MEFRLLALLFCVLFALAVIGGIVWAVVYFARKQKQQPQQMQYPQPPAPQHYPQAPTPQQYSQPDSAPQYPSQEPRQIPPAEPPVQG